jgi:hypothetical protein
VFFKLSRNLVKCINIVLRSPEEFEPRLRLIYLALRGSKIAKTSFADFGSFSNEIIFEKYHFFGESVAGLP